MPARQHQIKGAELEALVGPVESPRVGGTGAWRRRRGLPMRLAVPASAGPDRPEPAVVGRIWSTARPRIWPGCPVGAPGAHTGGRAVRTLGHDPRAWRRVLVVKRLGSAPRRVVVYGRRPATAGTVTAAWRSTIRTYVRWSVGHEYARDSRRPGAHGEARSRPALEPPRRRDRGGRQRAEVPRAAREVRLRSAVPARRPAC
jgi:hypothetical protein